MIRWRDVLVALAILALVVGFTFKDTIKELQRRGFFQHDTALIETSCKANGNTLTLNGGKQVPIFNCYPVMVNTKTGEVLTPK